MSDRDTIGKADRATTAGQGVAGRDAGRGPADDDEQPLPSLTEQVAEQLGGVRGLTEASIPVAVFVVVNILAGMRPALYGSVGFALAVAAYRLARRQPVRHALNGLFGIGLGAVFVLRSGHARDFHLTTILWSLGYGAALLASTVVRWPLVGFIWAVTFGGGDTTWRDNPRLRRLFSWLTAGWAVVYLLKSTILYLLWLARADDALGVARLILGYPVYAAVLAVTVWVVRRAVRGQDTSGVAPATGGVPATSGAAPATAPGAPVVANQPAD